MRSIFLALILLLASSPGWCRVLTPADKDAQALDAAAREYRSLDLSLTPHTSIAERHVLHSRALFVQQIVAARTGDLQVQFSNIQTRLVQFAPLPPSPKVRDVRHRLQSQAAPISGSIQRGQTLLRDTAQLVAETTATPTDMLVEELSTQDVSPITPSFWQAFAASLPASARRMDLLSDVERDTVVAASRNGLLDLSFGIIAALLILFPLRLWLRGLGHRVMLDHAPANRLRKSGQAFWIVVSGTLLPGLSATAAVSGALGGGLVASAWAPIAWALVRGAAVAGLICGMGAAIFMRRQANWRLVPLSNEVANALRPWSWAAAAIVFVAVVLDEVRQAAGLGGAVGAGIAIFIATAHILFVAALLIRIGRLRLSAIATGDAIDDGAGETGTALGSLFAWSATVAAVVCLILGYINLGLLVARLLLWLPLMAATFALALILTDDLCTGLVVHSSALGRGLHRGFGIRSSLIDQAGVFLSAFLRLALLLLGLTLASGPFGSNVDSLLDQFGRFAHGITIGEVTVSPGAVFRSLAVLAAGLFVVRVAQHWLTRRYLPVTELDAGARNSIATIARYAGLILATLWALASLGIGIERIALLLSALSVGIGFGLQAITQNFVSGLILLAERPVKIGDLVRIGDQEGDIRRISVRATEIEIADRSTLIVPNSELITKTIRNMTLADPIGRINLQFSVGLGADVAKVRDILLTMYKETSEILSDPEPRVFLDSITEDRANINSFAYVASPRSVYSTRSDLLFRLLAELPDSGITLGTTPPNVHLISPDPQANNGRSAPLIRAAEPKPKPGSS